MLDRQKIKKKFKLNLNNWVIKLDLIQLSFALIG